MVSDKIIRFFSQYKLQKYEKGAFLKSFEKSPEGIFCLKKGTVRCFSLSKDGVELTLNLFRPLSFFPMNWVINGKIDAYAYEAIEEVEVYVAPRRNVEKFLFENPDVAYDLLKRIYRGLEGYFLRMESLLSGDAYIRTVVQIIIHARRFGIEENGTYQLDITQNQLASLSGLSRETVTREIRKLEKKNIISYRGKDLIVLSITQLEQELSL